MSTQPKYNIDFGDNRKQMELFFGFIQRLKTTALVLSIRDEMKKKNGSTEEREKNMEKPNRVVIADDDI